MTRLGYLLHFGQLFKACGSNYFVQISHIIRQFLKWCRNLSFTSEIIFGLLLLTFGDFLQVTLIPSLTLHQFAPVNQGRKAGSLSGSKVESNQSLQLFLKMGQPRPLFHFFHLFKHIKNFTANMYVKNVHPLYGCRDSNS